MPAHGDLLGPRDGASRPDRDEDEVQCPPLRRREVAEWRRERIIDAALSVFGARGVEAASVKAVAGEAGVAPGLIYHYFSSKDELVLAVITERGLLRELRAALSAGEDRPAAEVLPELLSRFKRLIDERKTLFVVVMSGVASNSAVRQGMTGIAAETKRLLGDYLGSRIAAGELQPHDTGAAAAMLVGSFTFNALLGTPPDPDEVTRQLLHGLLATDGD